MKLYYSHASPYSRKVRMVIIEKDLTEQVDEIPVNPFANVPELRLANPLGKIPTLVLNDKTALFDSPVICHYLVDLASTDKSLISENFKWNILQWEALADGLTDIAYNLVVETRRPINEQSISNMEKWSRDIQSTLSYIDKNIHQLKSDITLAHLAVASSIGYLVFRLPNLIYGGSNNQEVLFPKLENWFSQIKKRPSIAQTEPHE